MAMNRPAKHSKELAGAIAEDSRRQAVDDAKKRAVSQHADYDTFKKLVSVAHLRPLHAPPVRSQGSLLPAWKISTAPAAAAQADTCTAAHYSSSSKSSSIGNPAASNSTTRGPQQQQPTQPAAVSHSSLSYSCTGTSSSISSRGSSSSCLQATPALSAASAGHVPRSSHEFAREWRRTCPTAADKYRLLKHCGADSIASIFKVEITGELLGQLLLVLHEKWQQQAQQQQQQAELGEQQQQQQQPKLGEQKQQQDAEQHQEGSSHTVAAGSSNGSLQEELQHEALFVVQLLHSLTGAGRFDLNARLIGSKAKQAAADLCSDVAASLEAATTKSSSSSSRSGALAAAQRLEGLQQLTHVCAKLGLMTQEAAAAAAATALAKCAVRGEP